MENKFEVEVDPSRQLMTVNGVKYSFGIFEHFANPCTDKLYSFKREGETVMVTAHDVVPVRESAALAPAQPRAQQYERR